MQPVILFRVDGGARSGLGHLHRCLALAEALIESGASCCFSIPDDGALIKRLQERGIDKTFLLEAAWGKDMEVKQLVQWAASVGAETIVVDSYSFTGLMMKALRNSGLLVAAVDDLAAEALPCHCVVNAAPGAEKLPYRSVGTDTQFLLGPRYALLPKVFQRKHPRAPKAAIEQVLVTAGGMDAHGLLPQLVRLFEEMAEPFRLIVVAGPYAANLAALKQACNQARRSVELVIAPASLAEWAASSDLAITAGGQSLLELAALGTPAIIIQTAENQAGNIAGIVEAKAALLAGKAGEPETLANVKRLFKALSGDWAARKQMAQAGEQLIDGLGAQRVAASIFQLLAMRSAIGAANG